MKNRQKNFWNVIFLFSVFGLTVYGVFKGKDITTMLKIMKQVNLFWICIGVICVIFFIWGESIIIYYLMNVLSIPLRKWTCFLFSSVGFFFSCITPSASGGQPMQIYYMRKKKIPIPVSTLVLMIVTITYKMVLVVIGFGMILFRQKWIQMYLMKILPVFYLGIVLNVICVTFLLLLVFYPRIVKIFMKKGWYFLEKIHILKYKEERFLNFERSMDLYRDTAVFLKEHFKVIVYVFALTCVQRIALFFTTYFVYRAFGLAGTSMLDIVFLQAAISISVDMLPLPGGMGISETLFLTIFAPVFGSHFLLSGLVLSRGLAYYGQLFFSAGMTAVAQFTIKSEKE